MNRLYLIDRALAKATALDYDLEALEKIVHTINGRLRDEETRGNYHDAKLRSHESRTESLLSQFDTLVMQLNSVVYIS